MEDEPILDDDILEEEPDICDCGECEECIALNGECTCGDCDICRAAEEDDSIAEDLYDDVDPEEFL